MRTILILFLILLSYCSFSQIKYSLKQDFKYQFIKIELPKNFNTYSYCFLPMCSYSNYKCCINKQVIYKNYYIGQIQPFMILDQKRWVDFWKSVTYKNK